MRSSRSFSTLWQGLGKPEHHETLFQNQKQKQKEEKEENTTISKVDWMSLSHQECLNLKWFYEEITIYFMFYLLQGWDKVQCVDYLHPWLMACLV